MNLQGKRILLTGSGGFLGSHIKSILITKDPKEIRVPDSKNCDLRIKENCVEVVKDIDVVFHIAGVTGGIGFTKKHPGSVFYDNLMMGTNIMEESRKANVEKFISTGANYFFESSSFSVHICASMRIDGNRLGPKDDLWAQK